MNKTDLIERIVEKTHCTKKAADLILSAALEAISESVASGDKVTLVGFGTFEARERASRNGRNPATGEAIEIPASRVPAFSAGKNFKQAVA